jgi:hypothetical protein
MKNILAKGGIEFLAVFLGIILSLWVDDYSNILNDKAKEKEALVNISNALRYDLKVIEGTINNTKRVISMLDSLLFSYNSLSLDSVEYYSDVTQQYVSFSPQMTSYETLKNTGQLYKISNLELLGKIITLYDIEYSNVKVWLGEDKRNIFLIEDHFIETYSIIPSKYWWITMKDKNKGFETLKNDWKYFNYLVISYNIKTNMVESLKKLEKVVSETLNEIELSLESN